MPIDQGMMTGTPMGEGMMGQPGGGTNSQGPVPMGPPVEDPYAPQATPGDESEEQAAFLNAAINDRNLAERFKNKKREDGSLLLDYIGQTVLAGVKTDIESRRGWMDANKEWIKMAMLVREDRNWPWQHAANIKYPLIATAAMQFSARAYPSLVPADGKIVKVEVNQQNAPEALYDAAKRVSEHMSFQIRERMTGWEEEMDKLLMTMAITGICFKKTYYDGIDRQNVSCIVYPENLIVNYYARSLEKAYRKTEVFELYPNEIRERELHGQFLEVEHGDPNGDTKTEKFPMVPITEPSTVDAATPHVFYAVHTFWDLDDDGYEEPYVITIHAITGKVVRIIARWDIEDVHMDDDGNVLRIKPIEYFTAFPFIPNPDGSIYAMGFGLLLGPLNKAVNTLINQLVDAGTLNNLQSGFIAKGLRLKVGETSLAPGEWKVVNATGDSLKDGIFPLPSKEPSNVLYQLLGMLIQSGNQLASIAEIFVGKMPGQNTPATTTQETVQQGMAVFTAIYKRVYRSLKEEFKKLYRLNKIYTEAIGEDGQISGVSVTSQDYMFPDWMIVPGADPVGDSATIKMQKMQFVAQNFLPLGTINPIELTIRGLKDMEIPDAQKLIMEPQPQQDPKVEALKMKAEIDQQKAQADIALKEKELEIKERMAQIDMTMKQMELQFKQQMQAIELQGKQMEAKLDMVLQTTEMQYRQREMSMEHMYNQQAMARDAVHKERMNKQQLEHGDAKFKQQQAQQKAKPNKAAK